jgi:hypothetical protein
LPKSDQKMARADFFSALIFFIIGTYFVVEGINMPGAGGFIEAGGEPGRAPVLIGSALAILGFILLIRSIRQEGHKRVVGDDSSPTKGPSSKRAWFVTIWCITYAIGMLGGGWFDFGTSYKFATAVFIFVFIVGSEWQYAVEYGHNFHNSISGILPRLGDGVSSIGRLFPDKSGPYIWTVISALIQAAIVSQIVAYVFEQQFFIKLP